jgi:hypothetical protein
MTNNKPTLLHLPTNPYETDTDPFHFVLFPDQKLDLKGDITTRSGWKHKSLQDNPKTVPDKLSKSKKISEIWLSQTPTTTKRMSFVTTCHQVSF